MKKFLIPFIVFSIASITLYSQNKTIKGKVIAEDFTIVPFALIFINDTVQVGKTDLKGFFQIDIPISVKKISFMDIGFEQSTIELIDSCDEVEVVMISSCTCDFMTLKKVDKFRIKRFKKLPELHKEAFDKGLFKTEKACYRQEFTFLNKRNRRVYALAID